MRLDPGAGVFSLAEDDRAGVIAVERRDLLGAARACVMIALALAAPRAQAQAPPDLQPITDRNFTIDLHEGVIFGSPRLVAMGGAAFAVGEGATGLFTNAAAGAVRPTKPTGNIEWSAFFNSYVPAARSIGCSAST